MAKNSSKHRGNPDKIRSMTGPGGALRPGTLVLDPSGAINQIAPWSGARAYYDSRREYWDAQDFGLGTLHTDLLNTHGRVIDLVGEIVPPEAFRPPERPRPVLASSLKARPGADLPRQAGDEPEA